MIDAKQQEAVVNIKDRFLRSNQKKQFAYDRSVRMASLIEQYGTSFVIPNGEKMLGSVFQPILSVQSGSVIGVEALLRAYDGQKFTESVNFYKLCEDHETHCWLDRSVRAMHLRNFAAAQPKNLKLYLNAMPNSIILDNSAKQYFCQRLEALNLSPNQIVFEVTEQDFLGESLRKSVNVLRSVGIHIAVDDFGTGHSDLERVAELMPDEIKLDRSYLHKSESYSALGDIVMQFRRQKMHHPQTVLLEGVEMPDEYLLARDMGIDHVQGFLFSQPTENLWQGVLQAQSIGRSLSGIKSSRKACACVQPIYRHYV